MKWTPTNERREGRAVAQIDQEAERKNKVGPASFTPGKRVLLGGDGRPPRDFRNRKHRIGTPPPSLHRIRVSLSTRYLHHRSKTFQDGSYSYEYE
jgi:hypothetical protein